MGFIKKEFDNIKEHPKDLMLPLTAATFIAFVSLMHLGYLDKLGEKHLGSSIPTTEKIESVPTKNTPPETSPDSGLAQLDQG